MRSEYFFLLLSIKCAKLQECAKDHSDKCGSEESINPRWTQEWSEYEQLIEKAEKNFVECGHTNTGCSTCYDENIKQVGIVIKIN